MPFTLQMLRTLLETHPNRAASLKRHVDALEAAINAEPALCLHRVRTLFEAVHLTIAPLIGVVLNKDDKFPKRNSVILSALDFSVPGHPEAGKIDEIIKKLLGAINGTASALAELSNIPNLRHGGSLDWATLERQHAVMLGGLCDTLVSFLFEVAWSRTPPLVTPAIPEYSEFAEFNAYLDDEYGDVSIAGSTFPASKVLYKLDFVQFESVHIEWGAERAGAAADEAGAAA
ncbi:MAG: abortive infection family protein [Bauldia sp.]|nr:abortive infection family protein [Bauldia sp.]